MPSLNTRCLGALTALALGAGLTAAAAPASPYRRAAVPADGKIVLADPGLREWGPELVHYALDAARFVPGKLVLLGPDGKAVPFQVEDGVLAFVAGVAQGASATYTLEVSRADRSAENTTLKVTRAAKSLELANEFLAVAVPPAGERVYAEPVAAAEVPPPLLQWRGTGQEWSGGMRFATPRTVAATAFRLVREGPACVEYEARYRFAPKGEYIVRIRLSPGVPLAHVTEEFDMGETTQGEDWLLLDLARGWQPANITGVFYPGEQQACKTRPGALAQLVDQKKATRPPAPPVGGVGQAPTLPEPEPGLVQLFYIGAGAQTQGASGGVQLWDGDLATPGAGLNIAVVSLHSGSWRRTMALPVWHKDGAGVTVGLPVSVRPIRWCFELADDFSPFSTHEHDDGLSRTYGRREWGLYVGTEFETAQPRFGHIGLDRFKNWIVDWPEGPAARDAYPGGFFRKEHVERLRVSLAGSPAAGILRDRYLMSGRVEDAVRNAESVLARLKKPEPPYVERDFWLWGQANYRKSQLLIYVNEAEDALACPELPAELRAELRRWLALYAYVCSEPDWNPRGAGVHHGNNNMPINRTLALAYFAGLLPDHPLFPHWMDGVKSFTEFKLASQFSPGGEALECPTYSTYAPAGALNIAQNVLRNRGIADLTANGVTRRNLEYMAALTVPDPRFGGARIIPGMGNSSNDQDSIWGVSVATFLDQDPAFAGWCKAMFRLAGAKFGPVSTGVTFVGHPMYYLPDVQETPVEFKTVFMPAYGVVFRAHAGTPDETALLFRAGINTAHWDPDPLNVILYGRGAPLSPGTGYQYYGGVGTHNGAVYHNRVRVGRHEGPELFGRVDVTVADYGFGPSADYAVADRYLPPELFVDGMGEMNWRRHVLFLKSDQPGGPSYFVLRDTFPGGEKRNKWWTWLNLELPDRVSVDGQAFAGDSVPVEKGVADAEMPMRRGQVLELATQYGAGTWIRFAEPRDIRVRAVMRYGGSHGAAETKTIVEALAGPDQDYLYAVVPRRDGEAAPVCEKLADGVLRIVTAEATDYAFVADAPIAFERDGVLFSGTAGAVRVFPDRVALCLNAGSGRVGYNGMVFAGHGPFEKVVARKDLKPGVIAVEGGYEKKIVSADIGAGVTVRGEGPFEARLDGEAIRIRTQGRARVLHVTQPPFIIRPQYWLDGQEHMASWTDYPASGWGSYRNTWLIALPVPDGEHELLVRDFRFPAVWARPFTPRLTRADDAAAAADR
jgi:hypothetical protein